MSHELQTIDAQLARPAADLLMPDVQLIKARRAAIESIITDLFEDGVHYGEPFPGSDKKSLLQPGAEELSAAFGLAPDPVIEEVDEGNGHRTFLCTGHLLANGASVGAMSATCSTLESKYRYRNMKNTCPKCKQETVFANRKGTGFYCWQKKGGCGAQFSGDSEETKTIEGQTLGKIDNEDPADLYHTARMMSQKRWLVAITRRTFALSARFVDADGYRGQTFDWKGKGGDLLRSIPGDRAELWARVGRYTLREFGKEPRSITNVEGAVVMDWLRSNADGAVAADAEPPEDMSPVSPPNGKKPNGSKGKAAPVSLDPREQGPPESEERPEPGDGARGGFPSILEARDAFRENKVKAGDVAEAMGLMVPDGKVMAAKDFPEDRRREAIEVAQRIHDDRRAEAEMK